jgi:tRNA threonylcarbamoyladenosine modification (KEOPS) complex  Pcc1 subunit
VEIHSTAQNNVIPGIRPPQNSTRQIIETIQMTTMPRKPRQSRQNLVEQEGRIQLAIQALKNAKFPVFVER